MKNEDIQSLFDNELFLKLLNEHLSHLPNNEIFKSCETLETSSTKILASDLISEISDEINSVVSFNLKLILADEFTNILQDSAQVHKDVQQLKQKVLKMSIKMSAADGLPQGNPNSGDDFDDFEESLEQQKVRLQENNKQDFQLVRLRNEVQAIKASLIRFTSPGSQTRQAKSSSRLDDSRLIRLARDLQNIQSCPSSILQEHSIIDRYSGLQKHIDQLRELFDNKAKQQTALNEKYESTFDCYSASFRSVWNVVTMMEGSIAQMKKQLREKLDKVQIKVEKKASGIMDRMFK